MSETANSEGASESEKPVQDNGHITFPPFPDPTDSDFEDDICVEEREYYKNKFKDLNAVKVMRLHCTACDRHLGCSTRTEIRMRMHPMLRTLVCHTCHTFYNSGEFEKGDDGSELYCRWCGQGGQVYCCSDCPHVFCAKCIRRNLGTPKIKEIENADDWKCFKCNPKCLWDIRATCWAVLRYCDQKNKITYHTQDPELREAYQKDCAIDYSECCKNKINKRSQRTETKKKEVKKETDAKTVAANIISKIPSTIQVKKFASVTNDDAQKSEKKAQKRPSSENKAFIVKNPIAVAPCMQKIISPINIAPMAKKMKLPSTPLITPVRIQDRKAITTYTRIKPKPGVHNNNFNGFNNVGVFNNMVNDNINLSLENLTQGLDMSAVAAMASPSQDDDVVCTPDFPLEPLCEVTEDNDDDVQCITPGPVATPKVTNLPPPLIIRSACNEISTDNIIQMTENDVTVNAATGGLKFRVDPQTLSSNKMYRLPDGRIFAINANPNMPGGYSATIVALTDIANKTQVKSSTYPAKLNPVSTSTPSPKPVRTVGGRVVNVNMKRSVYKPAKGKKPAEQPEHRECDLHVPVEWYRYNLIDAVDALEYSLSRLQKLKKESTTLFLRTRSVEEMRSLHRTLERLLNTSTSRFNEIRDNLNKELKQYVAKKMGNHVSDDDDDDDDVEILPDLDEHDDPIFIDENSVESTMNGSEHQVDLTGAGSSEHNDSAENKIDNLSKNDTDPLLTIESEHMEIDNESGDILSDIIRTKSDTNIINKKKVNKNENDDTDGATSANEETDNIKKDEKSSTQKDDDSNEKVTHDKVEKCANSASTNMGFKDVESTSTKNDRANASIPILKCKSVKDINGDIDEVRNSSSESVVNKDGDGDSDKKSLDDKADSQVDGDEKNQDSEMSEEMIEKLLKEDNTGDENDNATNTNSLDIPEELIT